MPIRVLMLGWEFPPYISGGLGTACHGLVRALGQTGVETTFVLPRSHAEIVGEDGGTPSEERAGRRVGGASWGRGLAETRRPGRRLAGVPGREVGLAGVRIQRIPAELPLPYTDPRSAGLWVETPRTLAETGPAGRSDAGLGPAVRVLGAGSEGGYDGDLLSKIGRYASRCASIAAGLDFDVIHAHDWMTFPAGLELAWATGRPLVVQVHATEFDRSGENVCRATYEHERFGMQEADRVLAVSGYTKRIIVERYGIPGDKVEVVLNGVEGPILRDSPNGRGDGRTVLFLGRITHQKGPSYFLRAAERVAQCVPEARFLVAGWGDQASAMVEEACRRGLGGRIRFAGFLRGEEVNRAYREAAVYVMPSVSEPFGLTALEAARHGVPVVLSKNSGAIEVLRHGALVTDYWDVERMANQIVAVLRYSALAESLRQQAFRELESAGWDRAARRCVGVYERVIGEAGAGRPRPPELCAH